MTRGPLERKNPLLNEVLADDSTTGHEKRLARYSAAKKRQKEVSDHILSIDINPVTGEVPQGFVEGPRIAKLRRVRKQLEDCGEFLLFRHYYLIDQYKMWAGCTCKKHLLCALCAIRRAAKCVAVYKEKIDQILSQGDYDLALVTFTIKNGPDLLERFNHLQGAFQKLLQKRKNARLANPRTDTPFKLVEGAIYSYEVTVGSGGYHPHIHMIALLPRGSFKEETRTIKKKTVRVLPDLHRGLVKDWEEITGDSKIIDVRLIENEDDRIAALVETFKYALKMSEMDVETQIECYLSLMGRRLLGSMGALFGVKLPDNLNDELLPEEQKYVDLVYQYAGSKYGYQLVSHSEEKTSLTRKEKLPYHRTEGDKKRFASWSKSAERRKKEKDNLWRDPVTGLIPTVDQLEWI